MLWDVLYILSNYTSILTETKKSSPLQAPGLSQPQQGMSGSDSFLVTVGAVQKWRFCVVLKIFRDSHTMGRLYIYLHE